MKLMQRFKTGMGNLLSTVGRMNCTTLRVGRKKSQIPHKIQGAEKLPVKWLKVLLFGKTCGVC